MSQGHRRHGGRGYTLLYNIGLEEKEDRRTEEQKTEEQKNRKKINGTDDRRTKEQKQVERGTEKKGARGPEKARKLSPDALEQPYRALGAMLQLSCSIVTGLLEKDYGGGQKLCRNTWNDAVWEMMLLKAHISLRFQQHSICKKLSWSKRLNRHSCSTTTIYQSDSLSAKRLLGSSQILKRGAQSHPSKMRSAAALQVPSPCFTARLPAPLSPDSSV